MKRREFGGIGAAVTLAGGLAAQGQRSLGMKETGEASYVGLGRPPMTWRIRHALQIRDLRPETLQLAKQLGMEWVRISTPYRPDQDDYRDAARAVEAEGLKIAEILSSVHNRAEIVLNLPGRDEKIEEFKRHLRAAGAAGIRHHLYAHMANAVWSTEREPGRGGATCRAFEEGKPAAPSSFSHSAIFERKFTENEIWRNWEYFVKQIAPVAEEAGVKVGVHPDDPPGLTLGNVPRPIFSSFDGYKRAIEIANSPNIGMGLCVGCWLEGGPRMGRNVLDTIEYFGGRKKLFNVHFRNVTAPLPHFRETFLNEGYMDMYKVMRALRKVNFEGVLTGDHFPEMAPAAGPLGGQIYTIGYIQALIERANEEFAAVRP